MAHHRIRVVDLAACLLGLAALLLVIFDTFTTNSQIRVVWAVILGQGCVIASVGAFTCRVNEKLNPHRGKNFDERLREITSDL